MAGPRTAVRLRGLEEMLGAAVLEALDDDTPEAEDPDAGHDGEPFVEGGGGLV